MKLKVLLLGSVLCWFFWFSLFSNVNAVYSIEMQEAYYWALSKSITTLTPIDNADIDWVITRQAMAKMISNFSINVLWKTPDYSKECKFTDSDIAEGLLPHIITSCQLWLMGQWITQFNPYSVVTRAEFWTILSRALWWDTYDRWKRHTYYEKHLEALKQSWVMKFIEDPSKLEIRGYVFLMLMRTANGVKTWEILMWIKPRKKTVVNSTGTVSTWTVQTWSVSTWNAVVSTWTQLTTTWSVDTWSVVSWDVQLWDDLTWGILDWWDIIPVDLWSDESALSWAEEVAVTKQTEYTYNTEEKTIYNDQWEKIYWVLYRPDREDNMPIIVYSHWLGSNYESWIPYAEALAKSWVAVFAFDFRWGWNDSKSDWDTKDMSILTEKEDLETVLREVQKRDFIDKDNIVLWWASQWWVVAALEASSRYDIKWTILFFPAFSITETVKSMYSSVNDLPDTFNIMWMTVGKVYATDIRDLDIYSEISKDQKPVLIVHWTTDPIVPISYSEKANSMYYDSSLKKIQWWGHWFSGKYFDSSLRYVRNFLKDLWIL